MTPHHLCLVLKDAADTLAATGMSPEAKRFVRFCATGLVVAGFDFGLIWIFVHFMPRLAAVSVAYPIAVGLHFCLSRWWVFAVSNEPVRAQLPRFLVVVLLCWICTVGVTAAAKATVTPSIFVAKAIAIPFATLLSFLLMRQRVFLRRPASGAASGQRTGSD